MTLSVLLPVMGPLGSMIIALAVLTAIVNSIGD